jgi:hypothetical protein
VRFFFSFSKIGSCLVADYCKNSVVFSPDPTSPVMTSPDAPSPTTVGVTRSRTLPSRKKASGDDTLGAEGMRRERGAEKRVLKKQRRVSGGGLTSAELSSVDATASENTNVVTRTWGM